MYYGGYSNDLTRPYCWKTSTNHDTSPSMLLSCTCTFSIWSSYLVYTKHVSVQFQIPLSPDSLPASQILFFKLKFSKGLFTIFILLDSFSFLKICMKYPYVWIYKKLGIWLITSQCKQAFLSQLIFLNFLMLSLITSLHKCKSYFFI